MSQDDQEIYGILLDSLNTLGVNSPGDLTSLRSLWRKRYKEAINLHSGSREDLNDHLIRIESAYQQLSLIDASELKRIAHLAGFFKQNVDPCPKLDINVSIGATTASIYKLNAEYVISLITTLASNDANSSALFAAVEKALKLLKHRSEKGTWQDSRKRGFKVVVRSPKSGKSSAVLNDTFWLNLWCLLNQSAHFIYEIEGSAADADLFAQVESSLLLERVGIPPISDWLQVPAIESQWLGFGLFSSALDKETPLSDYVFLLARGNGIPMYSFSKHGSTPYPALYDHFVTLMIKIWDKHNVKTAGLMQDQYALEEQKRMEEEREARRIADRQERHRHAQEEAHRIAEELKNHRAAQEELKRIIEGNRQKEEEREARRIAEAQERQRVALEEQKRMEEEREARRIAEALKNHRAAQEELKRIKEGNRQIEQEREARRIAEEQERHRQAQGWQRRLQAIVVLIGKVWAGFLVGSLVLIFISTLLTMLISLISQLLG